MSTARVLPLALCFLFALPTIGLAVTPTVGGEITVSASDLDQYLPNVAYNLQRREYMVVWHDKPVGDTRKILGRRYTADGTFLAEYVLVSEASHNNGQPSIAYDTVYDQYLLVYGHDASVSGTNWDVYGRIIPWDGPSAAHTSFAICTFSTQQWNPRVAYSETDRSFMTTWWNEGAGAIPSYISAQIVSPSGGVANPSDPLLVAYGADDRAGADIAYNQARNEYLIVFQFMDAGGGHIYGVRMSPIGVILGSTVEFPIAAWPGPEIAPRVAASRVADEWAVAWQSYDAFYLKDIYARRLWVDGAGTVQLAAPVRITDSVFDDSTPDIAAFPESTTYLIAWEQQYSNIAGPLGISARTLDTSNTMGAPFAIRPSYLGETTDNEGPGLAGGHTGWFAAWEHERTTLPSYQDIHGAVITGSIFSDGFESGGTSLWSSKSP